MLQARAPEVRFDGGFAMMLESDGGAATRDCDLPADSFELVDNLELEGDPTKRVPAPTITAEARDQDEDEFEDFDEEDFDDEFDDDFEEEQDEEYDAENEEYPDDDFGTGADPDVEVDIEIDPDIEGDFDDAAVVEPVEPDDEEAEPEVEPD